MVTLVIDVSRLRSSLIQGFLNLENPEYLFRQVAFDLIALMKHRIHENGEAADGTQIGEYSNAYLRLRERKFHRSADPRVIVSLTRQLENDWAVIPTTTGYAIGFNNPFNTQKARWVEDKKGKDIFSLSDSEEAVFNKEIRDLVQQTL